MGLEVSFLLVGGRRDKHLKALQCDLPAEQLGKTLFFVQLFSELFFHLTETEESRCGPGLSTPFFTQSQQDCS